MAPHAVICSLCGGKFFKSSLAHHQKVCREKVGKQCHECAYCHQLWPLLEMDAHIRTCPAAQAAGAKPTGASAALAKRLCDHKHRQENGIPEIAEERAFGGSGMGDIAEYANEDDTRIACQFCGRKFAMDRIGKHQAICQKIASKPRRRPKLKHIVQSTAPMQSDWRKKSEELRAAAKAGRGCPLPMRVESDKKRAIQRPAAGSALAAVRHRSSPGNTLKVPSPEMARSGAFRRTSAPVMKTDDMGLGVSSSRQHRSSRSSSTGAIRPDTAPPLPPWGSGGPSRYGRECITSCPVRTTPHKTSWGGCTRVAVQEKEGFESNRCSLGNPFDRSWLYKSCDNHAKQMNSTVPNPGPRGVSAAPVLLGRCRGNESRHVHFA